MQEMLGLKNRESDLVELLESHVEALTKEDLMELQQERAALGEEEDVMMGVLKFPPIQLTMKQMSQAFTYLEKALEIFTENDSCRDRSFKVTKMAIDVF